MKVTVTLSFPDLGYCGKPFWAEKNLLINIAKEVHPKLSEDKKQAAVNAACEKRGIRREDYADLVEKAARPFYTVSGTRDSEIIIPQRMFQSFLSNASQVAPKAVPRIPSKGLTFMGVRVSDGNGGKFLRTGKTEKDARKFERFVKPEESNQRSLSSDDYIADFQATGVLDIDEESSCPRNSASWSSGVAAGSASDRRARRGSVASPSQPGRKSASESLGGRSMSTAQISCRRLSRSHSRSLGQSRWRCR